MTASAKFWDRIAERYAKKPVADEATYQKKLAISRDYFRPEMELFEFGCGTDHQWSPGENKALFIVAKKMD